MLMYADANVHANVAGGQDEESESISGSEGELSVHSDRYSFYLLYSTKIQILAQKALRQRGTRRQGQPATYADVC